MSIENLLDTIKELLSEVRAGYPEDDLFLVLGTDAIRQLKAVSSPYEWRLLPVSGAKGKWVTATIYGMPLICVPGYDGIKIMPQSELTHPELSTIQVMKVA